jgi:hypothetical protein
MSESEPANEFESRDISAVYRYYDYINDAKGNASTAIMAITELLEHLPAAVDLSLEQVFNAELYEQLYQIDPRAMNEKLALLPLLYIGPRLEQSNCLVSELLEWYNDVVKMILVRTKDKHGPICLTYDEANSQHFMCENSVVCPHRFLSRYLSGDAWMPDFAEQQYQTNPARAHAITVDKLTIGQKYGCILPIDHDTMRSVYENAYQSHIDDIVQQEMQDIDSFNLK